jgi:hypothetical protein
MSWHRLFHWWPSRTARRRLSAEPYASRKKGEPETPLPRPCFRAGRESALQTRNRRLRCGSRRLILSRGRDKRCPTPAPLPTGSAGSPQATRPRTGSTCVRAPTRESGCNSLRQPARRGVRIAQAGSGCRAGGDTRLGPRRAEWGILAGWGQPVEGHQRAAPISARTAARMWAGRSGQAVTTRARSGSVALRGSQALVAVSVSGAASRGGRRRKYCAVTG